MKTRPNHPTRITMLAVLLAVIGLSPATSVAALAASQALEPRTDINPALLYWQAFSVFPELDDREKGVLYQDTEFGKPSPEDADVASKFDAAFKLITRAARMKVPCDWGLDIADGPEMLMPNLIKIRLANHAAQFRAWVALADGRQQEACDELLAMLVLGRLSAREGTLVQVMIQVAIEDALIGFVAGHWDLLDRNSIERLLSGFRGNPGRATVADAVRLERRAFHGWLVAQLEAIHTNAGGDEAASHERGMGLLRELFGSDPGLWDKIATDSGGTGTGLIGRVRRLGTIYDVMMAASLASADQWEPRRATLESAKDADPLAGWIVPNVSKARATELKLDCHLAMIEAAAAHRFRGDAGFAATRDPFGAGPFQRRDGLVRNGQPGFELVSALNLTTSETSLFFVNPKSGAEE